MGPSPPKEFGHFPLLVIDHQFLKDNPPLMMNFSKLDNKPLIKNNVALSPDGTMMQNPSFSSGSSLATSPPILHENPNTKPVDGVWNDGMKNPFGMRNFGEEFLRNPAPLMMKMDQEYMYWQQQETMQIVQTDFKSVERRQRRMIKNRESAARSRARKEEHDHHHFYAVPFLSRLRLHKIILDGWDLEEAPDHAPAPDAGIIPTPPKLLVLHESLHKDSYQLELRSSESNLSNRAMIFSNPSDKGSPVHAVSM
ncbi:hypothetical protein SASPL_134633 [Salvia splendens]|uniref:BZIP domain-containing protein n=1 Tax=Salvia splendens TaxID=180675 RepID=A0A8X8WY39_SALSN|nr:hypothetical protein SASPL_134633 [Salvia splendens]